MQQKLKTIISESLLTDSQKAKWEIFLNLAGEDILQSISDVIQSDPEQLKFLTKNLEDKVSAIDNPDSAQWNEVIKEEKEYLQNID